MAEALTRKQIIQAVWNKFKAIIGNHDISGIGDGTVTGALAGLNGKLTIQTYTADGINAWKFNDLCLGMVTKTFATKEAISPWGGQRTIGNISNADFRPPYEVHCPCVGVNAEDGVTYPLRIIINSSGAIVVQNDSADYIGPQMIYANYFYKK